MATLMIRDVPERVARQLGADAALAGLSRTKYIRSLLWMAAKASEDVEEDAYVAALESNAS